jgi:CHAT domain-containing protein
MIDIALVPAMVFALPILAATAPPSYVRTVEPRLSGNWQWHGCSRKKASAPRLIEEPVCGLPNFPRRLVSIAPGDCEEVTHTQSEAVEVLAAARPCTDAAVRTLKKLADRPKAPASVLSDLAAAYLVRAQRNDRPSDVVRALDAADRAVNLDPRAPASRFNQALALEALGFDEKAITSWDDLRRSGRDGWAGEAAEHWNSLIKQRGQRIGTQWEVNVRQLPEAALAGNRAAVAQLIAPYPFPALKYLYRAVLPAWASARAAGNPRESRRQLRLAHVIAVELARRTRDRHALDAVEQIETTTSKRRLDAIQNGVLQLAKKRYSDAAAAFSAAGSPLHAMTIIAEATVEPKTDRALALLAEAEREVRRNDYRNLLALVHIRRGFFFYRQSKDLDALVEYDAAQALCTRVHDRENLATVHVRKVAELRIIGHNDRAWREAFQAHPSDIVDLAQRQDLLGELALSAVSLDCLDVALRYQNAVITMIREQLGGMRDNDPNIRPTRAFLGVAHGRRAAILGHLGDARAMLDLREAERLVSEDSSNKDVLNARLGQIREVEGQILLHSNPKRAAEAFTEAYVLASTLYPRTYGASLFVARAEARLLSGEKATAEADLRSAIAELRREERMVLEGGDHGKQEALWSPYFSRSRDAYARLIQQLMEAQQAAEAFNYAEQARAYELLNFVQTWTKISEPYNLPRIQAILPPATFLVEYWVLGNGTYAWLIGHNDFAAFPLAVGSEQLETWNAQLVQSAVHGREDSFKETLALVSSAILRQPLTRIAQIARERKLHPRVIFIPDAATNGLPFAALPDPADSGRYLIEQYPIAIAPSATLYAFSLLRDAQLAPAKRAVVTLVGDPAFDARLEVAHELRRLGYARAEVESIRRTYGAAADVVLLTGARATVPAFLRAASRSAVIHFAGHAIANPEIPSRSLLLLARSKGHTGALEAEELLAKLKSQQTRLVVLSACSTAGGVPIGAERLGPLVRPILAGGVPAAVGTLWDVRDTKETAELLVQFHKHYRDGDDADVALQRAQRDMLHHPKQLYRSATVWASFQMIGFASSPFRAESRRKNHE